MGPNAIRDGMTFGFQNIKRPIVSAAQVMNLPDLACFLKTPGDYPVVKLNLKVDKLPTVAPGFCLRDVSRKDKQPLLTQQSHDEKDATPKATGTDARNVKAAAEDDDKAPAAKKGKRSKSKAKRPEDVSVYREEAAKYSKEKEGQGKVLQTEAPTGTKEIAEHDADLNYFDSQIGR